MTDAEIYDYLNKHDWKIKAQDGIMDIFNTSHQILYKEYEPNSSMMQIVTPDNEFRFKWILTHYKEGYKHEE